MKWAKAPLGKSRSFASGTGLLGRWAFGVGAVPMVAALGYVAANAGDVADGGASDEQISWVTGLDLTLDDLVHGRFDARREGNGFDGDAVADRDRHRSSQSQSHYSDAC